jgi:pSer/pThr/pTyr-binding forkhead associated (FHA) protein
MAGFELNIREPGKPPRLVALTQTIVVGRSRRADVTVEDQEVGREQFRIGIDRGIVVLEGLGRTNRTMVDGSVLDPGARITLSPGARIMVGKTTFVLQNEESTALAARPQQRAEAAAARAPDKPGPVVTTAATAPQKPAAAQPPPVADQGQIEPTMQWQGTLRPGAAALPTPLPRQGPTTPPPPLRPPSQPPVPAPPQAGAPTRAAEAKAPRPPEGTTTSSSTPGPGPFARSPEKPITVALSNTDIVPAGFRRDAIDPHELETRLHDALPRLFVKGDTMKRRIRLLKTRCTVGRGESSDVLLPVESVSEAHAEIIFDGTRFVLRDCGSRNGTFVDGNHLRSTQQPLTRHSLIGAGTLRAIFLCNTRDGGKGERRREERALRMLVGAGRLTRDEGQQILRMASTDTSQSIAEIVLMETALAPTDWVTAIAGARNKVTLWDRIRRIFGRSSPPKPS